MLGVGALFIANAFLLKSPNKKDNEALNEIDSNLKNYEIFNNNLLAGVYELENKIDRYHALNKEVYSKTERVNAIIKLKEEKINYINRVFSKCGLVIYKTDSLKEQIKAVENDLITIKNKKQYYKDLINKAENYKKEKSLDVKPESTGSYDEINQECDELRKQISYIERVIKSGEDSLETLGLKKNYLEELQEREAMLIKRYKDVTLTLEYFLKAEESLKNKFVYPVKESFIKYSSKLEKVFGEKVTMDKNFEVYFERGGENKSREYLSAGQNVLCDLCLRLALIDNMYKEENPFIILDDPFITLDENYIKKALLLLSELKTDRQIIYFTCHKSREIS